MFGPVGGGLPAFVGGEARGEEEFELKFPRTGYSDEVPGPNKSFGVV
jgi:hypothetical protein